MATTYTASDQLAVPMALHAGMNVVKANYQYTAGSLTTSDIIFGVKVPNQATIIDGYLAGQTAHAGSIFRVGHLSGGGAAEATLVSLATLSATYSLVRFLGSLPVKISVTDGAANQWSWIYLTINTAGTASGTCSLNLVVQYVMP